MNSKVLILILNWNKKDHVLKLLNQIQNLEYKNFECLVVDNASEDNSVQEIKNQFPNIKILVNERNLGGTEGYNSGLRYALQNINCDYIWLIDNDAEINSNTLSHLVRALNKNEDIGIAGSRIIDIDNKDITIELGSFIRWDTIGVKPFLRNKTIKNFSYDYVETDYVAICSAIIRFNALKKTGVMDERFFIFWDDMDWGLKFKEAGFKVVAVPSSKAYHPSFTERKRGITTDFYYGLRNPLLVYSKNTKAFLRLKIFHTFLRNYCMFAVLLLMNGRFNHLKFSFFAIYDFVFNNWGKCKLSFKENNKVDTINISDIKISNKKMLFIFDSYSNFEPNIIDNIRSQIHDIKIYGLIDEDRKEPYEKIFDNIIIVNTEKRKTSLWYNFKVFMKILRLKFEFSVGFNTNPHAYATREYYIYNNNKLEKTNIGFSNLHKVIIATILGELISLFVTPIVFISSIKYGKKK